MINLYGSYHLLCNELIIFLVPRFDIRRQLLQDIHGASAGRVAVCAAAIQMGTAQGKRSNYRLLH